MQNVFISNIITHAFIFKYFEVLNNQRCMYIGNEYIYNLNPFRLTIQKNGMTPLHKMIAKSNTLSHIEIQDLK